MELSPKCERVCVLTSLCFPFQVEAAWFRANEFFALPDAVKLPYREDLADQRDGWNPLHSEKFATLCG